MNASPLGHPLGSRVQPVIKAGEVGVGKDQEMGHNLGESGQAEGRAL